MALTIGEDKLLDDEMKAWLDKGNDSIYERNKKAIEDEMNRNLDGTYRNSTEIIGEPTELSPLFQRANEIVNGRRKEAYGKAERNFGGIAKVWSGILNIDVTPEQVAMCMVGLKLVRQANSHDDDNYVDAAGYTILAEMLSNEARKHPGEEDSGGT